MIFITFPRSGVNFITTAIKHQTGVTINYKHDFYNESENEKLTTLIDESEDYIINIVRDPIESMASWISMQYNFDDHPLIVNGYVKVTRAQHIPKYINLYKKLLSYNNVIFINYKDLKEHTQLVLNNLYKVLDISIINNELDLDDIKQYIENNMKSEPYLYSSKNNDQYLEIKNTLNNMDLSECYAIYHQALDKCIKI